MNKSNLYDFSYKTLVDVTFDVAVLDRENSAKNKAVGQRIEPNLSLTERLVITLPLNYPIPDFQHYFR